MREWQSEGNGRSRGEGTIINLGLPMNFQLVALMFKLNLHL